MTSPRQSPTRLGTTIAESGLCRVPREMSIRLGGGRAWSRARGFILHPELWHGLADQLVVPDSCLLGA